MQIVNTYIHTLIQSVGRWLSDMRDLPGFMEKQTQRSLSCDGEILRNLQSFPETLTIFETAFARNNASEMCKHVFHYRMFDLP